MSRALPLMLCLASSLALGQSPEAKAAGLRTVAEREARSDSKLGCKDLLGQTRVACREVFTRGLKASCLTLTKALSMASQQAGGALFATGDAAKDVRVADASCRVYLRSLERAREKSEGTLAAPASAPPACAELAQLLDRDCFDDFASRGAFSQACEQVFSMANFGNSFVGRGKDAGLAQPVTAARCEAPLSVYRQLVTSPRRTAP
ncbi:MAG: hypothetical protein Q8N26_09585 [Myxococcales bacterium]|nr:hypothetical protein [Myxococcales bacterium]